VLADVGEAGQAVGLGGGPAHVAILSQTCDVVQPTKRFCLVAPAEQASDDDWAMARKGRRPLSIPLSDNSGQRWLADAGKAFSVPKTSLGTAILISRGNTAEHGDQARIIRDRIARAFSRFPFPDEVHPVFQKLRRQLQAKAGRQGNLGKVIDLLADVRVTADQWSNPGRQLRLHLILSGQQLIPIEDADPSWTWDRIAGADASDPSDLSLDRICELILANQLDVTGPGRGDATALLHLWELFAQTVSASLIQPSLNEHVSRVDVEVISDLEFTMRDFKRSESLDLEALSDASQRPSVDDQRA
jgi:hypothetical protein